MPKVGRKVSRLTAFKTRLKWLLVDRRYAQRLVQPPLIGYFWTGSTPRAHEIRDFSSRGLYLLTEECWPPGVTFSMAVQRTDKECGEPDSWIAVDAKIVRWGADGVGVSLVPSRPGVVYDGRAKNCASQKTLKRFFKQLRRNRPPGAVLT